MAFLMIPMLTNLLFFTSSHQSSPANQQLTLPDQNSTLNTIGFSPFKLDEYLGFIQIISDQQPADKPLKPFIISVTDPAEEMQICYEKITAFQSNVKMPLAMEINLSCPNIPGKIPSPYDKQELLSYLTALQQTIAQLKQKNLYQGLPIGIKVPPFTYQTQYDRFIEALLASCEKEALPIHLLSIH